MLQADPPKAVGREQCEEIADGRAGTAPHDRAMRHRDPIVAGNEDREGACKTAKFIGSATSEEEGKFRGLFPWLLPQSG